MTKYIAIWHRPTGDEATIFDDYEEAAEYVKQQAKYVGSPWHIYAAEPIVSDLNKL